MAAWSSDILFGLVGGYLLLRTPTKILRQSRRTSIATTLHTPAQGHAEMLVKQ